MANFSKRTTLLTLLLSCFLTAKPSPEGTLFGFTFFSLGVLSTSIGLSIIAKKETKERKIVVNSRNEVTAQCSSSDINISTNHWLKTNTFKGSLLTGIGLASLLLSYQILKTDRISLVETH